MAELKNLENELGRFRLRLVVAATFVLLAFGLLAARLSFLQVVRYEDLAEQAETNRTAVIPIVPNRGQIVDRQGVVLATNYSAYTLEITPSKVDDLEATIDALAGLVEVTPRDRRRFRRLAEEGKSFESLPIRTKLSDEEVARFMAQRFRFPGVDVKARLFRSYPLGETGSHLLGYIGRINQAEKKLMDDWPDEQLANYKGTEYIGKLGLEQSYEAELHGQTGFERVETSAGGRAVRRLSSHAPTPGNALMLSIDIRLQALVEDMFGDRRGALVAIDPRSGEVLAFVSKPTFDPNLFVDGIDVDSWRELNESIDKPLLNRALRGTYPPGSDLQALHGAGGAEHRQARADNDHSGQRHLCLWQPCLPQPRRQGPGAGGHVPLDRQVEQRLLLLAGQRDGRRPDARAALADGFRAQDRDRRRGRGHRRVAVHRVEAPLLQAPRAAEVVCRRDHLAGHRAGLQRLHHAATGQRHGHVGVGRPALQASAGARDRGCGHWREAARGQRRARAAALQARARRAAAARAAWGDPGGHLGALFRQCTVQERRQDRHRAGRGHQGQPEVRRVEDGRAQARPFAVHRRGADPRPEHRAAVVVENAGFGSEAAAPIARRVFDYLLLGLYPSEEDLVATRQGKSGAPIGVPRRAADVPLPGQTAPAAAPASAAATAAGPSEAAASAPLRLASVPTAVRTTPP